MIKVNYECDETGQKMEILISLDEKEDGTNNVTINFDPVLKESDNVEDPFNIALGIFNVCTGNNL